jgi:tRNA A-37 threonylcarbamoyl transferase component Bud32
MPLDDELTQPFLPPVGGTTEPTSVAHLPIAPPRPAARGASRDRDERCVALIKGTGPHLSSETDLLRKVRLRAAALFLIASLSVFLVRRITFGGGELWQLNVVLIGGIGSALAFLSDPRPISTRRLKAIELAIFGLMIVYLAIRQYHGIATAKANGSDPLAMVRATMIGAILLMFNYAMIIPNTWRAATPVILTIALAPLVTKLVYFATHLAHHDSMHTVMTSATISENIVFMTVASGLAIYGVHVLNSLRTEAFEARQLNQYKLVSLLGSGGMGDVYLAEHRMMKRPCALKLVRPDRAVDPISMARFEREVRATSRLSHPNTVEIYDYGRTDDGTFYYVMEYLPGLTLEDLVERHGPMPPARAIYLLRQACGALAEAHASGLIHRDLKPANIFAASRGGRFDVAKVLDFGLVKDLCEDEPGPEVTRENTVQGTPLYMAPEQAQGKPDLDHRIDLYAIGCVAYTLLTGRPPFERESRVGVMVAHAHDPVIPPSHYRPDLPDDLERIILRCLAKSPSDRPPDAVALEAELASCASAGGWDFHAAERWWREFEPRSSPSDLPA